MFAYKNHLTRVKREMQEIKERAKANSSNVSNQLEKIELLEKQLIVFREEALRLFEKIAEKDKIIEEMTIRLSELTNEKKYMDENVKMLLKKNKQLESRTFELTEVQSDSVNFEPLQSHYVSLVRPSTSSNIKCISRNGIKDTLCSDLADLCVKVRAKLTHFAPIRLE